MPWLTAWARLIVDDGAAADIANQAVALAASRSKRLRGPALKVAARREASRLLARGAAAPPNENTDHASGAPNKPPTSASGTTTGAYAPGEAGTALSSHAVPTRSTPDPREQTAIGRLELALETLAPHQRLACVSYFLDGLSTDAIAALFEIPRERAIHILEGAAPTIAQAVGDHEIPDFSAATDEVEVVTL